MSAIGRINCTVGFCSVAIRRNCCTARCCSIWYCFFKRLSPFSWQKKPPVGLLCRRLRVATFYDLPGILENKGATLLERTNPLARFRLTTWVLGRVERLAGRQMEVK